MGLWGFKNCQILTKTLFWVWFRDGKIVASFLMLHIWAGCFGIVGVELGLYQGSRSPSSVSLNLCLVVWFDVPWRQNYGRSLDLYLLVQMAKMSHTWQLSKYILRFMIFSVWPSHAKPLVFCSWIRRFNWGRDKSTHCDWNGIVSFNATNTMESVALPFAFSLSAQSLLDNWCKPETGRDHFQVVLFSVEGCIFPKLPV